MQVFAFVVRWCWDENCHHPLQFKKLGTLEAPHRGDLTWPLDLSSPVHQGGPLLHSRFTVLQQLFQVGLVILGPMISGSVKWITNFHLFYFFHLYSTQAPKDDSLLVMDTLDCPYHAVGIVWSCLSMALQQAGIYDFHLREEEPRA